MSQPFHIEIANRLKREGERLGRDGLSQRVNDLVLDFARKHPDGHYLEAIKLAGRLRAISLASRGDHYWGEKTDAAYHAEAQHDLPKFQKRQESQDV